MSQRLKGQRAVVVGASSGMGRATAVSLANAGCRVLAAARRADRLNDLQSELATAGVSIGIQPTDATDREQVARLVEVAHAQLGGIDLLVYATGRNLPERALTDLTSDNWDMMIATNLSGAFLCTRAVLPGMRKQGNGLIVYLSSAAVQMPDVSGVSYQASKHGLTGLAHGTRIEEKPNGIRTTVIYPGLCDTEIIKQRPVPTPQDVLDKSLDPQDVADAVLFVAGLDPRAVVPELQLLPSAL